MQYMLISNLITYQNWDFYCVIGSIYKKREKVKEVHNLWLHKTSFISIFLNGDMRESCSN